MKLKITDPKIPSSLILLGLIGVFMVQLANNPLVANIGGIIIAIAGLSLILIYFPILTFKLFGNKIENKPQIVNNIGLFGTFFIVVSILLRINELPGAGPIIVVGCIIFYLNFLPAWYVINFKKSDNYQRVLYFVFCTALGSLLVAYQFKTMHWPMGTLLQNLSFNFGIFIALPLGVYTLIFKRNKEYFNINTTFLFGFTIAFVISGVLSSKLANRAFTSNNKNQLSIEKTLQLYEAKNKFLYEVFEKSESTDVNFSYYKTKALELQKLTDSCDFFLNHLKTELVIQTDKLPEGLRDSITFDRIVAKTNSDVPTYLLIGDDFSNPRKDAGSAIELKNKIQTYIKNLDSIAPEEYAFQLKQANPFDFNDVATDDGGTEKWEIINFAHIPLSTIYTTITGYQANIHYMEMTLLNELFNKANINNKENMARELTDLALKYESMQQEKKISMLQKDQEMNDLKIKAKDAEISNREKTITYFIFGLIAFSVLTIFVIRSNVLRKQTNKELTKQKNEVETQKHLVEEKQKEVIESITYAKRLQQAILPSQNNIDKALPNNFILYTPKDLVAGDFYWMEIVQINGKEIIFIAAADSTGHGVPGAMVSVVCSNALNRALLEFKLLSTGEILNKTRELVLETFSKSISDVKDGMDISLLSIIKENNIIKEINWSGANNPLWYVTNNINSNGETQKELHEIKADKQPIGKTDNPKPFTTHQITYNPSTTFYLFTDGFADQFGGEKGKKFKYKAFSQLLLTINDKPLKTQADIIHKAFEDWKGNLEQVDDVCVIAIKI